MDRLVRVEQLMEENSFSAMLRPGKTKQDVQQMLANRQQIAGEIRLTVLEECDNFLTEIIDKKNPEPQLLQLLDHSEELIKKEKSGSLSHDVSLPEVVNFFAEVYSVAIDYLVSAVNELQAALRLSKASFLWMRSSSEIERSVEQAMKKIEEEEEEAERPLDEDQKAQANENFAQTLKETIGLLIFWAEVNNLSLAWGEDSSK